MRPWTLLNASHRKVESPPLRIRHFPRSQETLVFGYMFTSGQKPHILHVSLWCHWSRRIWSWGLHRAGNSNGVFSKQSFSTLLHCNSDHVTSICFIFCTDVPQVLVHLSALRFCDIFVFRWDMTNEVTPSTPKTGLKRAYPNFPTFRQNSKKARTPTCRPSEMTRNYVRCRSLARKINSVQYSEIRLWPVYF